MVHMFNIELIEILIFDYQIGRPSVVCLGYMRKIFICVSKIYPTMLRTTLNK